jgi:hypothetical protein
MSFSSLSKCSKASQSTRGRCSILQQLYKRERAKKLLTLRFVEQKMNFLLLLSANVQKRANPFVGGAQSFSSCTRESALRNFLH